MNCLICNKLIDKNRTKYCSPFCIKRAWYIRNLGSKKSYLVNNPEFWNTETGRGFKWEKWTAKLLGAIHREFKTGVDLLWGDKTIDVKSTNLNKRKNKRGKPVKSEQRGYWTFNCENQVTPDYFFCICLIDNKPLKTYLIPSSAISSSGACIGWKSKKFDKYLYKF